jgi:hypothetical protein
VESAEATFRWYVDSMFTGFKRLSSNGTHVPFWLQIYARVSAATAFIQRGVCDLTALTKPAFCATLTNFPTMSPTPAPPAPANNLCASAVLITGTSTTAGSTVSSTFDDVGFCGTINSGPGVWYKINGDGKFYELDTCAFTNFDTRISIFKGSCGSLVCVTGNDQSSSDFDCSAKGASRATFGTESGTSYFILVHGNFEFKGAYIHRFLLLVVMSHFAAWTRRCRQVYVDCNVLYTTRQ